MSALCGVVGDADPAVIDAMLRAAARGRLVRRAVPGLQLAVVDGDLHADATVITALVGELAPRTPSPALRAAEAPDELDGAFAAASWDGARLRLWVDPFGARALYWAHHRGAAYFATSLAMLLAVPGLPITPDLAAVHRYLTFSFVPGDELPITGVRRVMPGQRVTLEPASATSAPWFTLREAPRPVELHEAAEALDHAGRAAVARRLPPTPVGLYLSGGLDSSAVGAWLTDLGAPVYAFTLDFGEQSVELDVAVEVARHLGMPITPVRADAAAVDGVFDDMVRHLELPFGDAVTGPQALLARAARAAGLTTVFNGEGGDQLFGGWTNKPMVAAALYGREDDDPAEAYLKSFHKFYGLEGRLYGPGMAAVSGNRRALIAAHLGGDAASFLHRVRLTDLHLKGSQNILPRAERIASGAGLHAAMPLFDRALATFAFELPPSHKLAGATEKVVLKAAMDKRLPEDVVHRRKSGMSVPITDWLFGGLRPRMEDLVGDAAVRRRGLFAPAYVAELRAGQDVANETRRRRVGERLWALMMLEAWMRRFVDRR